MDYGVRSRGRRALYVLVIVSLLTSSLLVSVSAQTGTLISAGFDTGADGFSYQDDAFRGTGQPGYASGSYEGSGGYSGGGLRVYLGAIDSNVISNMSGGWVQGFSLGSAATVTVSFRYNLRMSSEYESDEYGQVLVSLDGTLYGQGGDSVAQMSGNGNGGSTETTGWQQFQFSAPLGSGNHTLILGGYNNKKTYNNEWTEVLVDDVVVTTGSMPPVADAGPDQSVTDGDGNGSESVTLDGTDSYDGDGTIVSYEWSEGGGPIASGENPTVVLAVGTHNITLTVRDNDGETDADVVVINVSAPGAAQAIVDRLSLSLFKSNIADLASFGDRCQMTGCSLTSYNNAQNWLEGQLAGLGYNVERHYYSYNGSTRASTYVTKVGTVRPDQMYMVACHLDGRGGGGAADDNGSGCSLLMEAARVFAMGDVETDVSIRFLFWGNEETGLHGSTQYRDDRVGLQGIENPAGSGQYPEPEWLGNITHDMVLYDHGVPAQSEQNPNADLDVEYRAGTSYEAASHQLADYVAGAAGKYSADYPAEVNNYSTNTDDTPYHNYCPSISVRENRRLNEISGVHPYYHTSGDVYSNYSELDFKLGFNAVQMTVGAVAELSGARIVSANSPPEAADDSAVTDEDTAVVIDVLANDTDSDGTLLPGSTTVTSGPGNGSTSVNGGTGAITYTPNADYNGGDSFVYQVCDDGGACDTATVTVMVNDVNDPPLAMDDGAATDEDTAVVVDVLANDWDVDGALVPGSVQVAAPPTQGGTSVDGTTGQITYTPNTGTSGGDSFVYEACDDDGACASATVSVTVSKHNDPPVANDDSGITPEDTAVVVDVLLNDTDLDGTLQPGSVMVTSWPANGYTGVNPTTGEVTYTPVGGFSGGDSFVYQVCDDDGACDTATVSVTINPALTGGPNLEAGTVSGVGSGGWTTVTLAQSYNSMVVVASANYDKGSPAGVVRVQNASGSSFQVRVDPAAASGSISGVTVHYAVVEEGVYNEVDHGVKMEAVKFTSTRTDQNNSWVGESRSYANAYSQPVVLGQVMTYNDPDWSVFWARGSSRGAPPSSSALFVGKHVGEDADATRADEVIGYVVIEAGSGTTGTRSYVAGLGADTVMGMDNSPPYNYGISGLSSAGSAIVSAAAMDGGNGGWPVLYGASSVSTASLSLVFDEDQMNDSERKHSTEQVAYIVFE